MIRRLRARHWTYLGAAAGCNTVCLAMCAPAGPSIAISSVEAIGAYLAVAAAERHNERTRGRR